MTAADKLSYLVDTKNAIKDAIIAKGVSVSDDDAFRDYAGKINDIVTGGSSGGTEPTVSVTFGGGFAGWFSCIDAEIQPIYELEFFAGGAIFDNIPVGSFCYFAYPKEYGIYPSVCGTHIWCVSPDSWTSPYLTPSELSLDEVNFTTFIPVRGQDVEIAAV